MAATSDDPAPLPLVSLIICSRNRAESLEQCLAAIQQSDVQDVAVEVIIVDNGSTDKTAELLRSFSRTAPFPLRLLTEPRTGLACARNTGVSAAWGDLLAFTDDDCYVGQNYFSACVAAFRTGRFHFCGGRILPFDPDDAKYGFNEDERFNVIPAGSLIAAGQIQGANMVFRRSVIDRIGLFDPLLGAGTAFRCEDVEYASRASLAGFVGAHIPQLTVYHHHRRKAEEISDLKRLNDFARGAYYAKRICEGHWRYASFWARETWRKRRYRSSSRELRGALSYLAARKVAPYRK